MEALHERRIELEASLRALLGVAPDTPVPVSEEPPRVVLPAEPASALQDAARKHPSYQALGLMAGSREREADSAFAEGLPSFMLGFDYIEIGEAAMATPESGKDAVSVTIGVTLPLWTWAYDDKEGQLRAEGRAFEARRTASSRDAVAEVDRSLARIRDAHRRVRLYRTTLIPQAETAYEGALAGYATGDGGLAPVLLAQRELLSLSIELFRAQAMHARAWARLEEVVGRKAAAGEGA
jgi:outer membrane protein TolC